MHEGLGYAIAIYLLRLEGQPMASCRRQDPESPSAGELSLQEPAIARPHRRIDLHNLPNLGHRILLMCQNAVRSTDCIVSDATFPALTYCSKSVWNNVPKRPDRVHNRRNTEHAVNTNIEDVDNGLEMCFRHFTALYSRDSQLSTCRMGRLPKVRPLQPPTWRCYKRVLILRSE